MHYEGQKIISQGFYPIALWNESKDWILNDLDISANYNALNANGVATHLETETKTSEEFTLMPIWYDKEIGFLVNEPNADPKDYIFVRRVYKLNEKHL